MKRTIKMGPEAWAIDFKEWDDKVYVIILQRTAETQIETVHDLETFQEWLKWIRGEYDQYMAKASTIIIPEEFKKEEAASET